MKDASIQLCVRNTLSIMHNIERFPAQRANGIGPYQAIRFGWEESRPLVQAAIIGRFLAGAALAFASTGRTHWQVAPAAVAWLAAGFSVYVFNGVNDVVEDRANGSSRPIASGRLTARAAMALVIGGAVLALAAAVVAGEALQAAIYLALGYVYSGPPFAAKRHWAAASLVITASGAVTFWTASRAGVCSSPAIVIAGATLAAWMGLVGALVKDLSDVAGDRISGCKNWIVTFGESRVERCAAELALGIGLFGAVASAAFCPQLLPAMAPLLVAAIIFAVRAWRVSVLPRRQGDRSLYRVFMAAQITSILMIIMSSLR